MVIGVLYDRSGRIISTWRGPQTDTTLSQEGYKYGLIRKAPAELESADLLKELKRLRVKDEYPDGTVEVELAK